MFGLSDSDIESILKVLRNYPDLEEALVFGSRAMGNYKKGSDIDIALKGDLDPHTCSRIYAELNEGISLPYKFDIIEYQMVSHVPFLEHIDRYGKILYKK